MIILKHLTIERFRLLRAINLHFPQRGSILIQGPNEAGKSALIESIYFALYGEPLVTSRGKRPLDDLILYGASSAIVTLTLAVGASEMTISRTIERGRGQSVQLHVRRLGMPEEAPLFGLKTANERIIAEMGRLDGDALRNACLVEQKGLGRLESISGMQREGTVRKLLGLEMLSELTEQFQVLPEDEQQLQVVADQLKLADIQSKIPHLSERLQTLLTALDAVQVSELLTDVVQQESEISELEQMLEQIQSQRLEIKSRQSRIQQLKKADATLAEIIASYDDMAESRAELPELEKQIAELERREREELPQLELRVNELAELTRSFGTLQRMSNDLLIAVENIKEQEQEFKQYNALKQDLKLLDEQIIEARARLNRSQQALLELEEKRRSGRPQLEARLLRMRNLAERLQRLEQFEARYSLRLSGRSLAEENTRQLQRVLKELREIEQELKLVEKEAKQAQQQSDSLENTWRQASIRRQMEEWQRQKSLLLGLSQAEQHVRLAHQHHAKLNQTVMDARSTASRFTLFIAGSVLGALICLIVAIIFIQSSPVAAIIALILMFACGGIGAFNFYNYRSARVEAQTADQQLQEALTRVGMMSAARESAMRMAGKEEELFKVENEIRSLGGNIPPTLEDAQHFIDHTQDQDDLGAVQLQMKEKLAAANVAREQVNLTMEAVAKLRKERAELDEVRHRERWDEIEDQLRIDRIAVEQMQQEIILLAGQDNLPLASVNARLMAGPVQRADLLDSGALARLSEDGSMGVPELAVLVDGTIKATEHELVSLDGKLDHASELSVQVKAHQGALDTLLIRQNALEERMDVYQAQNSNPEQQLEQAREHQISLRSALQSLQDSLRLRVKPLGVSFGQAAINSAEIAVRKQLEELQITLGKKIVLQERHTHYGDLLKERQESLSEHYKQLAKFSNTLGSWIVPLNPFAEALVALRTRCQKELVEANEEQIQSVLDNLFVQEGASNAKISLCTQEIADLQDSIKDLLETHQRTIPAAFVREEIVKVWPLIDAYSVDDRQALEEERATVEQELHSLQQQDQDQSTQLGLNGTRLDLDEVRARMEQVERAYNVKQRGNLLVKAVDQRLLRKIVPRTEYYMQQILPLLTGGRYHDVHLSTEEETATVSGGALQIQVWDSGANAYVPTSALSGGAADQLSLALRLAFVIAALPRELNAAPGFVMLDEPLSSFDRGRAQALVNVVTGELLSQHFEQVLLVSHSSAFDPAMFPYHLYMDNGLVVESNLPVVANPLPATFATGGHDHDLDADSLAVGVGSSAATKY